MLGDGGGRGWFASLLVVGSRAGESDDGGELSVGCGEEGQRRNLIGSEKRECCREFRDEKSVGIPQCRCPRF